MEPSSATSRKSQLERAGWLGQSCCVLLNRVTINKVGTRQSPRPILGRIGLENSGRGLRNVSFASQANDRVAPQSVVLRPAGKGGEDDRRPRIRISLHRANGCGVVRARPRGARHRLERGVRALDRACSLEGRRHQGSLEGILHRGAPLPRRSRARGRQSEGRLALCRPGPRRQRERTAQGRKLVRFAAGRAGVSRDRRGPRSAMRKAPSSPWSRPFRT